MTVDNNLFWNFFGNGTEFVSPSFKDCKANCSAVKATNSLSATVKSTVSFHVTDVCLPLL